MPLLEMRAIHKSFPGAKVLKNVDFCLEKGEIHALLGENGAGKSTLMKILTGIYSKDSGEIHFDGSPLSVQGPREAEALGIVMIHQEFNLVPQLSIAENIFLGNEGPFTRWGTIRWSALVEASRRFLDQVGLSVAPTRTVDELSVGEKQLVEVAKALSKEAKLLIMDEPTAALTETEKAKLFSIMTALAAQGVSIIFISHRMEELFAICDRVTVLRDGAYIATRAIKETTIDELVSLMVGRQVEDRFPKVSVESGDMILEVEGLQNDRLKAVNLTVRAGEVVGIGGLMGAGRTEVARAIYGLDPAIGSLRLKTRSGGSYTGLFRHPAEAIAHGIAMVPEDRKDEGLVLGASVKDNMALPTLAKRARLGVIDGAEERSMVEGYIKTLRVKTAGMDQPVRNLSGGNQQKVVFGKCLETKPRLLILDEPTRGVDVGAKVEIYQLINQLAAGGIGILLISSDLPELMGMSDRIYVMYEGSITGHFTRETVTEEAFMRCATGGRP
ncbi:ribose abc transporter, ATP-binding protein rbsa [Heliomicrobium modesticaldum Ice1]|uniref:Ribose abc transporter, ATP-binding protein rbsa n=1 Tax=Heliobacterium modesticaldum (strain ATCC 51547 / Ice1) TaxID=498761 RepID=B0TIM7_HELMI|nr:sugar ABC transporter ATP-binding protein [Heliomicrobium modesticaldum]ABZ84968.1 ribose abc transporter, ATP-binding protein rbsa [Heliomicrobium modesticaldum Ice1]